MSTKSLLFKREPNWIEHRRGTQHQLPESVQSWVYETGSLTQRLRRAYGSVSVTIVFHQWHTPYLSESKLVQLGLNRYGLIREVLLHNRGKPLLIARTVIPPETIKVAHRNLAHLGSRPLGEVIFSYPDLERILMDVSVTTTTHWTTELQSKTEIAEKVWGRRTVYGIHGRPLLVSEFFLPEILSRR